MQVPTSLTSSSTMTAIATARYLTDALGGNEKNWSIWLANDRKPGRVNRKLPVQPGPGRPRYAISVVDAYVRETGVKAESQRSGSPKPRDYRFAPHISAVTIQEGAVTPFVLLVPDGHFKFPHLWPPKLLQAERANYRCLGWSGSGRLA